jgi:hypothetical protein
MAVAGMGCGCGTVLVTEGMTTAATEAQGVSGRGTRSTRHGRQRRYSRRLRRESKAAVAAVHEPGGGQSRRYGRAKPEVRAGGGVERVGDGIPVTRATGDSSGWQWWLVLCEDGGSGGTPLSCNWERNGGVKQILG